MILEMVEIESDGNGFVYYTFISICINIGFMH